MASTYIFMSLALSNTHIPFLGNVHINKTKEKKYKKDKEQKNKYKQKKNPKNIRKSKYDLDYDDICLEKPISKQNKNKKNEKVISKKQERLTAIKTMNTFSSRCPIIPDYYIKYIPFEMFPTIRYWNDEVPFTKEVFFIRNKAFSNIITFTNEELELKWKNVGTIRCSNENCQHNILCTECGGDSHCLNCIHMGEEKNLGMCANWISGYNKKL